MSIPPESIQVVHCYLSNTKRRPRIMQVIAVLPDGRVHYQYRTGQDGRRQIWRPGILYRLSFWSAAKLPAQCDRTTAADL
jgi:hypothetical protein